MSAVVEGVRLPPLLPRARPGRVAQRAQRAQRAERRHVALRRRGAAVSCATAAAAAETPGARAPRTPEERAERAAHRRRHKARKVARRRELQQRALLRAFRASPFAAPPAREARAATAVTDAEVDQEALEAVGAAVLWQGVARRWADARAVSSLGAVEWAALPEAADPGRGGGLKDSRKGSRAARKRAQVEAIHAVLRLCGALERPGAAVVDFGCGSGNLLLALAATHPTIRWVGVDGNAHAAALLERRAAAAGLQNVTAVAGRIEGWAEGQGREVVEAAGGDVAAVVALHVCGAATDHALLQALALEAAFIALPCCIGKVGATPPDKLVDIGGAEGAGGTVREVPLDFPRSTWLREAVSEDEFASLCAAADFAGHQGCDGYDRRAPEAALPRAAVLALGSDRLAPASEAGYSSFLAPLPEDGADVRGHLLLGVPPGSDAELRAQLLPLLVGTQQN